MFYQLLYPLLIACFCFLQHSISLYSQNWTRNFKPHSNCFAPLVFLKVFPFLGQQLPQPWPWVSLGVSTGRWQPCCPHGPYEKAQSWLVFPAQPGTPAASFQSNGEHLLIGYCYGDGVRCLGNQPILFNLFCVEWVSSMMEKPDFWAGHKRSHPQPPNGSPTR